MSLPSPNFRVMGSHDPTLTPPFVQPLERGHGPYLTLGSPWGRMTPLSPRGHLRDLAIRLPRAGCREKAIGGAVGDRGTRRVRYATDMKVIAPRLRGRRRTVVVDRPSGGQTCESTFEPYGRSRDWRSRR
jgi:hypothetical protein